ncbi:MAG TPA: GDP-mannose 4,6-dehydratase [Pyrinomonadaceae bacterium]|jgi:GDPmannose 4,6-dehydratase
MKRALITGITGQDGSYLADHLLGLGYEVHGIVRRVALEDPARRFNRIAHLLGRITIHAASLESYASLFSIFSKNHFDECYHLAAQSFVAESFADGFSTLNANINGTHYILAALREIQPGCRFYFAGSSEMFGKVAEVPQTETTRFHPRSPYGISKVAGFDLTRNYREAYGMFCASGILFNHECVTADTPVFTRRDGLIDILPIEDVVPHRSDPRSAPRYTTQVAPESQFEVWDSGGWTPVTCMTATWNGWLSKQNKAVYMIAARGAVYHATSDHVVFASEGGEVVERQAGRVRAGDSLALISPPEPTDAVSMTEDEAWLLGIIAAEGYVSDEGKPRVVNQDVALLDRVAACWRRVAGGCSTRRVAPSGFEGGHDVAQLDLTGANNYGRYVRDSLYTRSGGKRIPKRVLNATRNARMAFLRGFNDGDGLKSTPCTYQFQGFKTSSAAVASALYWLALTTLGQQAIICTEQRGEKLYYQINLNSPAAPGNKGRHLRRPVEEVVKAEAVEYRGWLFDLSTASGTFHAGVGQGWIHNSPRRGFEFVTRKITSTAARIRAGQAEELRLGNLDARRDWGHAADYVRAMHLMLQQGAPDDFVVATGETHTVREFCERAFSRAGLDWERYVRIDERFYRPAEVELLIGDSSKARRELGWEPGCTFERLVDEMVDEDLRALGKGEG